MKTSIKTIFSAMTFICVESAFALNAGTVAEHNGTDYYLDGNTVYIQTLDAFKHISELSSSIKSYALANDIYFNETAPEEGCASDLQMGIPFAGVLDGMGYAIKNICLTNEYTTISLFHNGGNESTIKNLTLSNAYVYSGTTTESGALFYTGLTAGMTVFDNVHIENAVIKGQGKKIGGFIGGTTNAAKVNFTNSSFEGNIFGSNSEYAGAFIGYAADDTKIINSYAKANINVTTNTNTILGGLVGEFANDAAIISSYFKGKITLSANGSKVNVGGLLGKYDVQDSIEIAGSYATNTNEASSDDFITINLTNATGYNIGGLVGHLQTYDLNLAQPSTEEAYVFLHESFAKGAIKVSGTITGAPTNYIGGIIGWAKNNNWYKLHNSYYLGAIETPKDIHEVYGLSSDTSSYLCFYGVCNGSENYNGNVRSSFAYDANGTATRAIRGMYNWGTWSTTKDSKHGEYTVAFTTDKEKSVAVSANVDGSSNRNMVLTSKAFADLLEKYDDNPENITWIYDAKLNEGFPSLLSELPGKTFTIVVDDTVNSTDIFKLPTDKIPTSYEYGAESVVFPKLASLKGCFVGWNVNGEDLADGFTWNPGDSYGTATATPLFDSETCNKTISLATNSSYGVEWEIKTSSVSMPIEEGKATLPNLNGLVYTVAATPIDASESIVEIASDKLDISDDEFVYDGNEATITATTKADYYYVKWLKNEETVAMAHAIGATYLAEDGTDIDLATLPAIGIGKEDDAFGYYANGDKMWNGENSIAKDVSFTYTALKSVNITVDNIDGIRISGSILEGSFDYELANNKSTAVPVLEKMTIDTLNVLIVQFDALGNRIAYEVSADGKLVLESGVTSVLVTPVAEYAINVMVPTDKGIIFTNDEQPTSYIVGDASVTFPKLATTKACFTGYTGKANIVTEWVPEDSYGDAEFTATFDSECTPKTNKINVTADSKIAITVTYKDQALEIVDGNILVPEGEWKLTVTATSTDDKLVLDSIRFDDKLIENGSEVTINANTELTVYTTPIYTITWLKDENIVASALVKNNAIIAAFDANDEEIEKDKLPATGVFADGNEFAYYANKADLWNGSIEISENITYTYAVVGVVAVKIDKLVDATVEGNSHGTDFKFELSEAEPVTVPAMTELAFSKGNILVVQFDPLGNRVAYEVSADGAVTLVPSVASVLVTPVAEYAINVTVPTDKGIIFTNDEQPTSYTVGDASVIFPTLATTKACFTGYTGKAEIVTEWAPEDSYGDVEFTAAFDSECTPKTNKINITADSLVEITVTYKDQVLESVDGYILVPEGEWPLVVTAVSTFDSLTLDSIYWNGSMIATGETVKVSGNTDLTAYTTLIKPEPEKPDTIPTVEPDTTYSDTLEVVQSEILFSGSALKFEISTNGSKITDVATLRVKIFAADSIYLDSLVSDSALAQKYNFEYYPLPAGSYTVVAELANDRDTSVTKASAFAIDSVIATILPEQWAMISLAGVDSTFEIPEYEQGSIYYWDEENALGEFWQYRSLVDVAEIQPTQGYWIYAEDSMVVKHLGTVAKAESLEWNLKNRYTGWNLVANPYSWKILLPSSEFDDPENAMEPYWRWNASKNTYEVADTLNVFEAVWAHTDENKVVTIDAKPIYSSNIVAAPKSSAPAKKSWSLRLKLASDNGIDEWNSIGVGTREISLFAPPASMRDGVSLSIKDGNNDLAKSIKSSVENASWNVAFEASSIQNAKLSVDGLEALQELGLQATLTMDGESVVLEPNESVDVVVSALAKNAEIEVAPIAQIAKASGIQNLRFNRAGNMLDVSFELASNEASKNADIRLIDARGKTVSFIQEKPVAGLNKISIAIPEVSGVFYLQVKVGKHSELKRIAF